MVENWLFKVKMFPNFGCKVNFSQKFGIQIKVCQCLGKKIV